MSDFKVGDRVRVVVDDWLVIPRGTTGMVVNADAFAALWADYGIDVETDAHPPARPPWQIVGLIWDEDPALWPKGEIAFASPNEVEKIDA